MIPGTTSIRLDINTDTSASGLSMSTGVIEAVIGRIPLEAKEATGITLRMEGPLGSEPELEVREKIGGQDVGGRTYRPPTPLQVYLPVILKSYAPSG